MRLKGALGALVLLLLPTHFPEAFDSYRAVARAATTPVPAPPALKVLKGKIGRNTTLGQILSDSLSPANIHALVQTARPAYDLARISVGHPFDVTLGPDGLLQAFSYGIDELRTLHVKRDGDDLSAEVKTRPHRKETVTVSGEITSSLFGAVEAAGEPDQLAIDLADVFAWDVDFNTELQKGDRFRVVVEKTVVEGEGPLPYGNVLAAELKRGTKLLRAVRYDSPRQKGFFAPDGTPLRKTFLRSPLKFTRITSGFTQQRFHPILGVNTPHLGIDYGAPTGTPVHAAADGTVEIAGWVQGFGNTVKVRHSRGFETLYGHLSRINVRPGQSIGQGTVVGLVGMTGLATGPHLDYRTIRNGVYVNPLTVQSAPPDPIGGEDRDAFEATRDRLLALLAPAATGTAVADARPLAGSAKTAAHRGASP